MPDQELIKEKMQQIEDLLLCKNHDYGNSFHKADIPSGTLDPKSKLSPARCSAGNLVAELNGALLN